MWLAVEIIDNDIFIKHHQYLPFWWKISLYEWEMWQRLSEFSKSCFSCRESAGPHYYFFSKIQKLCHSFAKIGGQNLRNTNFRELWAIAIIQIHFCTYNFMILINILSHMTCIWYDWYTQLFAKCLKSCVCNWIKYI